MRKSTVTPFANKHEALEHAIRDSKWNILKKAWVTNCKSSKDRTEWWVKLLMQWRTKQTRNGTEYIKQNKTIEAK